MPRVQDGYDPRAEALQTTAAPNIQAVQARFDPNESKAFQLAAALGKATPIIDRFNEDYERKKLQEQMLKIPAYQAQFMKDNQDGAVTAAQVGQKFPEMVPVIRARVAEGIGNEQGKKMIQPVIDEIMGNQELMTDTAKRAEFIKTKREELIGKIAPGNEFYSSGVVSAIDKELNQYENSWQRKTAEYHKEVQTKDFSGKVVEALSAADPKAALEALDAQWKTTSSLNNLERNQALIDSVTKQAFAADDPSLLDKIPTRFLNVDTQAQLKKTKIMIQEQRMTTVRNAQTLQGYAREENLRNSKVDMVNKLASDQQVNPVDYKDNPDAFNFALQMKEAGRLPEAQSSANVQKVRSAILNGATTAGLDQNQTIDQILANKNINPKDKADLIKEVPRLIEGTIAMNDDMVKSAYSTRVGASLDALEKSTNSRISSIITGTNLRGKAVGVFDQGIRQGFNAYYEENGKWPTGRAKQEIVDSVVDKAEKFIETQVRIGGQGSQPAAPTAAPAPRAQIPKVTSQQAYDALAPGADYIAADGKQYKKGGAK